MSNDPRKQQIQLSITVPVYKRSIPDIRKDVMRKFKHISTFLKKEQFELIYVLDGHNNISRTRLARISESIQFPNLFFVVRDMNMGKGFSVVQGYNESKGKYIGYCDFGRDIDVRVIKSMYNLLSERDELDAVLPNKYHKDSQVKATFFRKFVSSVYILSVWITTGLWVRDTQTGAKLYRREAIKTVLPMLLVKRFAFEVEILVALKTNGFSKWAYVPVNINLFLEESTFSIIKSLNNPNGSLKVFWDTAATGYRSRILNWYSPNNDSVKNRKGIATILEELN